MPVPATAERDYNIYLRRHGRQAELADYLDTRCRPLWGSKAYVDGEGSIFYYTWRDQSRELIGEAVLPPKYILISPTNPQADIFAPFTRYRDLKEIVIHQINDDDGAVESAIRSVEHILDRERGRETQQTHVVRERAGELLTLFAKDFASITPEEFRQAQERTYALLRGAKLDPDTVVSTIKQEMTAWLLKGSFGTDTLNRYNWLISVGALSAAYRRAIMRHRGIQGPIEQKYVAIHGALSIERQFSRGIFYDVAEHLKPEAMPSTVMFRQPLRSPTPQERNIALGLLRTLQFQLEQPRVKTYRPVGRQVAAIISDIEKMLAQDERAKILETDLFGQAERILREELINRAQIYPPEG